MQVFYSPQPGSVTKNQSSFRHSGAYTTSGYGDNNVGSFQKVEEHFNQNGTMLKDGLQVLQQRATLHEMEKSIYFRGVNSTVKSQFVTELIASCLVDFHRNVRWILVRDAGGGQRQRWMQR
ncbi:hypothetical protein L2E82_37418 [Cichorium intybus]|uniref:Uncharacterized protein n=1 Tax=Cichorium intybus TaxID=13427 RepID=A0ACB9AEH7_CICIN|nr:hypothetical protein L2E82_37418 [Cichorium intybus]